MSNPEKINPLCEKCIYMDNCDNKFLEFDMCEDRVEVGDVKD